MSVRLARRTDADQADLRSTGAAERLATKAARRAPRAQGMTVSHLAAASVIDLIKRLFVFMVVSCSGFAAGLCPVLSFNLIWQSGQFWAI